MYRFLATPKWVGFAALMVVLSAVMIGLGFWQLDRYHIRHGINVRISQASAAAPVPLNSVISLTRPATDTQEWVRVSVTGTYDPAGTVVARDRSVNSTVGFEMLVPLRLADGSSILVDRGWIPPGPGNGLTAPKAPPVPPGPVTVTGRIHLPESKGDSPVVMGGQTTVRRIDPRKIAPAVALSSTYTDYLLLDRQSPAAPAAFTQIPADTQPSWMNAGYTVQWWLFAALALALFGWAARREARDRRDGAVREPGDRSSTPRDRLPKDRLADDQRSIQASKDRLANDAPSRDRLANDRLAKDRLANDRPSKDRLADDRATNDRRAKGRLSKGRQSKDRLGDDVRIG